MKHTRIAVIGVGTVGSTIAYALIIKNLAAEIILIDIDEIRCKGEILDLSDAIALDGKSKIRSGNTRDAAQADIIIIAAGKSQKPGQTRADLLATNKQVITDIFREMNPLNPNTMVIIVTNPVDTLTLLAQSISGLPHHQVFGSGTFLDTLRLRGIIADQINISRNSIDAFVIGEHGDSQVVVWSCAEINGKPITNFTEIYQEEIAKKTKERAYEIIACKGSTHFGIAECVATICQAIIFDQKLEIPLSTHIKEYNTVFSMPVILGKNGIEKILSIPLNNAEQKKLLECVEQLKKLI